MKKALVHLSLMLLLAALLVPLVGCKKDEPAEETPAAASDSSMGASSGAAMGTDMGSGAAMGTDMATSGADMGATSGSTGTDMAPPKQ
ncbi:MAG TPA: hypothetical protein VGE98_06415 [Thermoanaerobaculia bacterium]